MELYFYQPFAIVTFTIYQKSQALRISAVHYTNHKATNGHDVVFLITEVPTICHSERFPIYAMPSITLFIKQPIGILLFYLRGGIKKFLTSPRSKGTRNFILICNSQDISKKSLCKVTHFSDFVLTVHRPKFYDRSHYLRF